MSQFFPSATKAGLLCLTVLTSGAFAAEKTPAAMKIPVNSQTVPAATTDKSVPPATEADNSGRNKVHDGESAVTADQQSNGEADVETTRKIRKAITDDSSLSTYAHNVKIITVNGSVVLKGPVKDNSEKAKIENVAKKVAGKDKVVSEIEVR